MRSRRAETDPTCLTGENCVAGAVLRQARADRDVLVGSVPRRPECFVASTANLGEGADKELLQAAQARAKATFEDALNEPDGSADREADLQCLVSNVCEEIIEWLGQRPAGGKSEWERMRRREEAQRAAEAEARTKAGQAAAATDRAVQLQAERDAVRQLEEIRKTQRTGKEEDAARRRRKHHETLRAARKALEDSKSRSRAGGGGRGQGQTCRHI